MQTEKLIRQTVRRAFFSKRGSFVFKNTALGLSSTSAVLLMEKTKTKNTGNTTTVHRL